MNKKLFEKLFFWPKAYISGVDFISILDKSAYSRQAIIKRAVQEGFLSPLRRDLFLINNSQFVVNAFEVAALIYGPSYISFESALSHHGWIPEAVRTTTSASVKRTKEFLTPIGAFSYEHIPLEAFSFGVEQHTQNKINLFIATPCKALADMIYARKRTWKTSEELLEDLRIEPESFENVDKKVLRTLIENYPSERVKKTLSLLLKSL